MSIPHPTSGTNSVWTNKVSKTQWSKELLAWDKKEGNPVFHLTRTPTSMQEFWGRWLQKYKQKRAYLNGTGRGTTNSPRCYQYDRIDMLAGQRMGINPGEILDGDPSEIMLEKALEDTERYQDDEIRPRNQRLRLPSISSDEDIDPLLFITDPSPSPTQLEPAQALDSERDLEGLSQTIIHGKSPQITSSQETPKGPARKRKLKGGHDSFIAQAMQEAIAAKLEMNDRREETRKQQFEAERELHS
jgi:hypothetical protein